MAIDLSLGKYLKRVREDRRLTLREAAKQAGVSSGYLSQIEGEKRGRRKGGNVFAPHPDIMKSLARVYHVPLAELLERAGYLSPQEEHCGFYEDVEVNRCFEFVIHDPALGDALTTAEKKHLIYRYETLTGRKLITWAGDDLVVGRKSNFAGLRLERGLLYASRTIDDTLTEEEVRQELHLTPDKLRHLIAQKSLKPIKGDNKPMLFHTSAVLTFKRMCLDIGYDILTTVKKAPRTSREVREAVEELNRQRQASTEKYYERFSEMSSRLENQERDKEQS